MKKILVAIVVLLCLSSPVEAWKMVDADMIKGAQEYGLRFAMQDTERFLLPWTVYEEKADWISDRAERSYIYTPYLLIALNAKDKVHQGVPVRLVDSEKILTQFNGFLTVELVLYGTSPDFAAGLTARLQQNKKRIDHHQIIISPSPVTVNGSDRGETLYRMQCYVYFPDKGIHPSESIKIIIKAADNKERRFKYNLSQIP